MKTILSAFSAAAIALIVHGASMASVVISATRVVFPSNEKEVTIRLSNEGQQPGLVQIWLDNGDPNAPPERIKVPFALTPPVFRIEAGKGQAVRMLYTQANLPQDRETVYWLNVLEIPPKPDDPETNYIQMAFRTRIKVFFRPKELNSADKVQGAVGQLRWTLVKAEDGKTPALAVNNPTPYHVSFTSFKVDDGSGGHASNEDGGMVEPLKTALFPLQGKLDAAAPLRFSFTWLNDYGVGIEASAGLSR